MAKGPTKAAAKPKPYNERSDLEKLASQWKKLTALRDRNDYSAAITRCATAAEIAANIAVRHEFKSKSQLTAEQVNSFLKWANGLDGKMRRLILPLRFEGDTRNPFYRQLAERAEKINDYRNRIVHSGEFSNRDEARDAMVAAETFIEMLVGYYHQDYSIPGKMPAEVAIE
jgi:hypothetical protein